MNFDRSRGGVQRADYEQFASFLGLNRSVRKDETHNNAAQNQACSGTNAIAMVYPVKQAWCGIYEPDVALVNGTIFEELNKPFYQAGCSARNKEGCL